MMNRARKLFKDVGFELVEIGSSHCEGIYITYQGNFAKITFIDSTKTVEMSVNGIIVGFSKLYNDLLIPIEAQKEELGWYDEK